MRQQNGLWAAVIVLTAGVIFLTGLILVKGLDQDDHDSARSEGDQDSEAVAEFMNEYITEEEWVEELKYRHGEEVLTQLLNRKSVLAEAKARNITVTPAEIEQEINQIIQGYESEEVYYQEMYSQLGLTREEIQTEVAYRLTLERIATADIQVTDEEVSRYLEENGDYYHNAKQMELSLIIVKTLEEANEILDALEQGADFAQLARERSIDEFSKNEGGRIGIIEENDPFYPQNLLSAAASLEVGDIAGPFEMDKGFGIIQLNAIIEQTEQSPEEQREEIRRQIALNEAVPLTQLEESLRGKYGARILVKHPAS